MNNQFEEDIENEMIERYLYDVVRRLPEKQREDIKNELRTLIEDMLQEQVGARKTNKEDVERILIQLGNPSKLARKYREEENHLIGGEYYDTYCYLLKIVLICTTVGIVVSNIVSVFLHVFGAEDMMEYVVSEEFTLTMLPGILISVFGWITLIFALMERYNVKIDSNKAVWSPSSLPHVPYEKAIVKRGEVIADIIFQILILAMFCFAPQFIGAWSQADDVMVSVPIFNLEIWSRILPIFVVSFLFGIIPDIVELIVERYSVTVAIISIVCNIISFLILLVLFRRYPIWNNEFIPQIESLYGMKIGGEGDILNYFNTTTFTNGFLLLFAFIFTIDSGTKLYKALMYGKRDK